MLTRALLLRGVDADVLRLVVGVVVVIRRFYHDQRGCFSALALPRRYPDQGRTPGCPMFTRG